MNQDYRQTKKPRDHLLRSWSLLVLAAFLLSSVPLGPLAQAAEDQSYQALRDWIEQHRTATPTFTPGQTLTLKDRQALEPFIPQTAWEYYFFDDMEMEIAETGQYPPPPDWGQNIQPGYSLDENGVLVGFTGGGFPFPEIDPKDPQAAVKVFWNLNWRPGAEGYVMPMVAWSRSQQGKLDRQFEFTAVSARYAAGAHCAGAGL
ncbi:MAG: hypothetical protein V3S24_15430 [Candidatus Tectomicrobia bacterium]